jgi:predicted N-acetyltransferase YhbS
MKLECTLRREPPADHRAVETLTREAFWNLHGPGCDEHYLAHLLRGADTFIPALDYVAESNGRIVGNILYAKAHIALDAGGELPVITFGPVSVLPEFQRRGIGKALIEHTLALAREKGYSAVLIYGDPAYYGRLGLRPAEDFGVGSEQNEYCAALQAQELRPGALQNAAGRFVEGSVYHIDEAVAAIFDQAFPPKEKLSGTPSQQRFLEVVAMHRPRHQVR